MNYFSLATFKIPSLTLDFWQYDYDISRCISLWDILVHSPLPTSGLLESQEYVRAFQSLLQASHSRAFLIKILSYPIVCLHCYPSPQAAVMFNNCLWLFWQMPPGKKWFSADNVWVTSNKGSLASGVFQRTSRKKKHWQLCRNGALSDSSPFLPCPVPVRLLVSPWLQLFVFQVTA